ncbi:MAG: hypothetical protein ACRBEE_12630 [Arenicella sp.]
MKKTLRTLFGFILTPLERGEADFKKNPLGRKVLIIIGLLFSSLGGAVFTAIHLLKLHDLGYLIPGVVFTTVGVLCLIVGCLGNDRAVAKVWGNH